ncbi:hypothetical protein vseg_001154 [Gypsophila vaccaria]
MENCDIQPLNHCHVHKLWGTMNRLHMFLHSVALAAIFYYRLNIFFSKTDVRYDTVPLLPWLVIFGAEIMLSFIWALRQPFYWRPVTRTVFTERLPKDADLPGIDVFVCTADPNKEPTINVMNTVVSAMALDYPAQKLSVYLSDDAGASVTLQGLKDAWAFATWWLPFCRRYNVKPPCPQAYFEKLEDEHSGDEKFVEDRNRVQEKYEIFKQRVTSRRATGDAKQSPRDHPALVQVIDGSNVEDDASFLNPEPVQMPLLVYVAREKRLSYPHHFKAGALNALQRVSSILSNSPYILILDCDMYCNDSISARQAMCFYLDSAIASSLAWVQYPQKFHNICENDIYDSQFRLVWTIYFPGANGLHGPLITGTNVYIKRKALYDVDFGIGNDVKELRESLGPSNELIKSVGANDMPNFSNCKEFSSDTLQEAHLLASCIFEKDTKWGKKVGFWYDTVVEDVMTGSHLHSKGWKSVYMNPGRPQFLGSATTNFDDMFTQGIRWYSGFADIVLSKYNPLILRPSKLQLHQKMLCSYFFFEPFYSLPVLCFATVPPLCFLYGIPLYPQVSDPFFKAFAFVLLSSWLRHMSDVLISGGSVTVWLHEQRVWIIRSMTSFLFGSLECILTRLGVREASFNPTNKAGDDDKTKWYQMGKFDFRTSDVFILPLLTAVTLNLVCLIIGLAALVVSRDMNSMFVHMVLSFYALLLSLPVIEGMLLRKDSGRVPLSPTLISASLSLVLLSLGYLFLVF